MQGHPLTERLTPAQCNAMLPKLIGDWKRIDGTPLVLGDLMEPWIEWLKSEFAGKLTKAEPYSLRAFVSANCFARAAADAGWVKA